MQNVSSRRSCASVAYRRSYPTLARRTRALQRWVHAYNVTDRTPRSVTDRRAAVFRGLPNENLARSHTSALTAHTRTVGALLFATRLSATKRGEGGEPRRAQLVGR